MFVPEKMKCNKLRHVDIPKGKTLYNMNPAGLSVPPDSAYTGDVSASSGVSKIDEIEAMLKYDFMKQREESLKESKDSK